MSVKILNIITNGLNREGITTTQLELVKAMNKDGLEIDIAAVHDNDEGIISEFEQVGCRVIRFPDRKNKKTIIKYIIELRKCIRHEHYDIVHVHGSSSILAIDLGVAKQLGVKRRIAHSRNTMADHMITDKILRPLFYCSYTEALACGVEAGKWLFPGKPYVVVHNGKNLKKFSFSQETRNTVRQKYGLRDEVVFGFVGHFNKQKNIPFLIELIRAYAEKDSSAQFFLMGDGPEREYLVGKIHEYNLDTRVHLTGRISNVSEMLQGMDIMLFPSLFEGLPNVVLEWQASGLPAIISDKITRECCVSDLVSYAPIDQGTDIWMKKIDEILESGELENREENSKLGCDCLKENGFDLRENAIKMRNYYLTGEYV